MNRYCVSVCVCVCFCVISAFMQPSIHTMYQKKYYLFSLCIVNVKEHVELKQRWLNSLSFLPFIWGFHQSSEVKYRMDCRLKCPYESHFFFYLLNKENGTNHGWMHSIHRFIQYLKSKNTFSFDAYMLLWYVKEIITMNKTRNRITIDRNLSYI